MMRATLPLLFLALLAVGCSGLDAQRRGDDLELAQLGFENALRWGRFDLAAAAQDANPVRPAFDPDRFTGIRVSAVTRLSRSVLAGSDHVAVRVRIGYYRTGFFTEKVLDYVHTWAWDEAVERWFMVGELPAFE